MNMFDCVPCYGHDVYIDDNIVGYVERLGDGDAAITISGKDFARLTSDGKIVRNGEQVGDISMDGMIYFGIASSAKSMPRTTCFFTAKNCKRVVIELSSPLGISVPK